MPSHPVLMQCPPAGETLQATCEYDSRTMSHAVRSGATHHDEMCNLYFMMWTELPIFITCFNHFSTAERHGPGVLLPVWL